MNDFDILVGTFANIKCPCFIVFRDNVEWDETQEADARKKVNANSEQLVEPEKQGNQNQLLFKYNFSLWIFRSIPFLHQTDQSIDHSVLCKPICFKCKICQLHKLIIQYVI